MLKFSAFITAATMAISAASPALAASSSMEDLFPDKVVAKGNGVEIKRSQLDRNVLSYRNALAQRNQTLTPDQLYKLERDVLHRMLQVQLLLKKATDAEKAKGQAAAERRIQEMRTSAGGDETLSRRLKAVGVTVEEVRTDLTQEMTAEAVLEKELKIQVSDAEVKKFYDDNPAKFEQPEAVRVTQILCSTKDSTDSSTPDPALRKDLSDDRKKVVRKNAEDVLKRARAGENFDQLTQLYTEDQAYKENRGIYTLTRDAPFVIEFKNAAFALTRTNEISGIVTTLYGYHILRLDQKVPARKLELAKVSDEVRAYLKNEILKTRSSDYTQYMDKLSRDGQVEILDPKLKPQQPEERPK